MNAPLTTPALALSDLYRFSVEQYSRLGELGVLADGEGVELLDGLVVKKMPKHPPHTIALRLLTEAIRVRLPAGWQPITQDPIALATSQPEPDLAVVPGGVRDYLARHPAAADVALLVEVSESTLPTDRGWKLRLYAADRIAPYWIVNLVDRVVEVYTDPRGAGDLAEYGAVARFAGTDAVPLSVGGLTLAPIPVADLMP